MEAVAETLKRTSVAEVVKRARDQSYVQRLTRQQERTTKDLGGILVPSAFQVPNEVIDEGWLRELGGGFVHGLGRSLGGGGRAYAPTNCTMRGDTWSEAITRAPE